MKKSISLLLAVMMVFTLFTAVCPTAFAASGSDASKTGYVCTKKTIKSEWNTTTVVLTYDSKGYITKKEETIKINSSSETYKKTEKNTYDKNGNLTKTVVTSSDDPLSGYTQTCTYDKNGNITKLTMDFKADAKVVKTFSYDKDGRITKLTNSEVGDVSTASYTYDKNGRLSRLYTKSADRKSDVTYKYDKNGRLTLKEDKYKDGSFSDTRKNSYVYDKNGNLTKETISRSDVVTTFSYTYDSKGNMKTKSVVDKIDGSVSSKFKITYTYDKNGNLSKETYSDDSSKSVKTYKYDSKNRLISETETYGPLNYTTTYSYGKNGNMATRVDKAKDGKTVTYEENDRYSYTKNSRVHVADNLPYEISYDDTYTYTGKAITPSVKVSEYSFDAEESYDKMNKNYPIEPLFKGADYTVRYKNNKNPGTGKIIIDFVNPQKEDLTLTFTIVPKQVTGLKASSSKKGTATLSWKSASGAKYYKVQQSTDGKTWTTVKSTDKTSMTINSLKSSKTYKFRVCSLDSSKKYAGKYSQIASVKVK